MWKAVEMKRYIPFVGILSLMALLGCSSGGGDILQPEVKAEVNAASHHNWGVWEFTACPEEGTLDAAQLRTGNMHLNALQFLEPPALVYLTLDSVEFIGDVIECDIGLRHPFLGLDEFTGFDVSGILITNGSVSGFEDPNLVMAGDGDTRLLNPDGYTRWWNPSEFPYDGTMFGYKDGMLGTPDVIGHYNSTLNAYKFFCDDLDADDPVGNLGATNRCVFTAGQKNVRHYSIEMGDDGLVFNYAVDASWKSPTGDPPWEVPGSFDEDANKPEAWHVSVTEFENTLWNDGVASGGDLRLQIMVWDHYDAEDSIAKLESPGNFPAMSESVPYMGGSGYAAYGFQIYGVTPAEDEIEILVQVESNSYGYQGLLPGEMVTAYLIYSAEVSGTNPGSSTLTILSPDGGELLEPNCPFEIEWGSTGDPIDDVKLEYSTDGFITEIYEIIDTTSNDGEYGWDVPEIESDTVRVRVSDVLNAAVKDISDDDFSIAAPGEPIWPRYKFDSSNQGVSPYNGPSTNHVEWTFPCADSTTPGPSIGHDGTIYIGTNNGYLQAVNPDGTERYSINLGSLVLGTPAIAADNTVYAGVWGTGKLVAVRCEGEIEWEFDTLGDINKCHPAIADDGTIYVGNNNGRFFAINPDGTQKWTHNAGGGFVPSPCIGPDGEVYFAMSGGTVFGIEDIGQDSYDIFWQHTFTGEHMTNSPSVDDNGVVYACGLYLNTVWACDPETDTILWTFDAPDGFDEASVTIGPDYTIYIGCNDNRMYAVNPGGTVKWSTPVADRVPSSVILDPSGRMYFGTRGGSGLGGTFYCLDSDDGSEIWNYSTGNHIRSTAAIAPDGTLYVGGHDGVLRAIKDE